MIKRNWRIVFMGTPAFAVPALQFLLEAGYTVAGVVTAPDKPGGRGMKQLMTSPVKEFALKHGLHILQPKNLKSNSFVNTLQALQADIQVVVAFRMLPEIIWSMPPQGTINLHGSLLPAYRGAAPIHWAVIRGERMIGVTTFKLDQTIDTGHILLQQEMPILDHDTTGTLHDRMMFTGAGLVLATLDGLYHGDIIPFVQNESAVSHAPKIHHEDGRIDWNLSARQIYNLIRGMSPYPGAWTLLDGKEVKIWASGIYSEGVEGLPGAIRWEGKSLIAQSRLGEIEILELQMTGKKRMSARDFTNGYAIKDWLMT